MTLTAREAPPLRIDAQNRITKCSKNCLSVAAWLAMPSYPAAVPPFPAAQAPNNPNRNLTFRAICA